MVDTSSEDYKVTKIETKKAVVRNGRVSFETEVDTFDNEQETDQQATETGTNIRT